VLFNYAVKQSSFHPKTVIVNGKSVDFKMEENKYRDGGAVIPTKQFLALLNQQENIVEILL
jgi:hypothetical protein